MAEVLVYTRQMCGFCSRAKRLLKDKGVTFKEIDATFDAGKRAEMVEKSGGGRTFPQILINERPIGGCDDLVALDQRGDLDALLGVDTNSC